MLLPISFDTRSRSDLSTVLERDLKTTGLGLGDYEVFALLMRSGTEPVRMSDLAEELGLSPSGLTRRLDGLVRSGWVERRNADHDRRVMLAVITPEGRRIYEAAIPVYVSSVRRHVTSTLTDDELRSMAAIFNKIRNSIEAQRRS